MIGLRKDVSGVAAIDGVLPIIGPRGNSDTLAMGKYDKWEAGGWETSDREIISLHITLNPLLMCLTQ